MRSPAMCLHFSVEYRHPKAQTFNIVFVLFFLNLWIQVKCGAFTQIWSCSLAEHLTDTSGTCILCWENLSTKKCSYLAVKTFIPAVDTKLQLSHCKSSRNQLLVEALLSASKSPDRTFWTLALWVRCCCVNTGYWVKWMFVHVLCLFGTKWRVCVQLKP